MVHALGLGNTSYPVICRFIAVSFYFLIAFHKLFG